MDVLKAMKNRLEVAADGVGGTDMEKKVKAATSLENWPATNTQLHELSQATNDYQYYKEIMSLLWKRLGEPPRNWRTIYKSLVLLEHLLRYGSPRVIEEARDRSFTLRQLHDFHFREPDTDKDRGSGIRDKSKQIVDLLADAKQLEEVRATAKQNLHKFVGVSNSGSVSGAGSMYGGSGHGSDGRYDDRGFGGGAGAFGASSGGSGYDEHVSRSDREKAAAAKAAFESRRSEAASASASSPYAEADADAGEKKKKKKKKKSEDEEGEDAPNPYEEAAPSSAKKKKKAAKAAKAAEADADEGAADEEAEKKKAKKLKIKMRDAPVVSPGAPVALAAPPAAAGDDDGFGDFGNFTTATPAAAQPPQQQQQSSSSFDNFDAFGSSSGAPAPAAARPVAAAGGDLLDMFASASIDNSGSGGWGSSVARNNGPVDFLSAAPAQPQKQAAPSLFDAAVPVSKQKQQSQQAAAPKAELQLNDHNNADAFSSFVAGHKPAASAAPSKPAAAAAPKKSGELAWENNLVDLGSMASSKAPAGKMAPAPFIGGSSLDPFAGLGGAQQQQQRMAMQQQQQQQRPPQMGGAGMQGMGMGMGGGMMGMQGGMQGGMGMMGGGGMGMGMGMGGGQQMPMGGMGMGMGGMGMGMGMPGAGGMAPMGGMGGGPGFGNIGFTQQADPNKIFF